MRYLFLILAFFLPLPALALTGPAARFDFSAGAPAITSNTTSACNNQATVRYDFVAGMPAQIFDTTATCTAAVVVTTNATPVLKIQGGTLRIQGGNLIVK